jgi:hypothetical protein
MMKGTLSRVGFNELLGVPSFLCGKTLIHTQLYFYPMPPATVITIPVSAPTFPGHSSLSCNSDAKTFSRTSGISCNFFDCLSPSSGFRLNPNMTLQNRISDIS